MRFWRRKKKQLQPRKDQNGVSGRRDAREKSRKSRRHRRRSGDAEDEEGRASGTFGFNLSSHFENQTREISIENGFTGLCLLI